MKPHSVAVFLVAALGAAACSRSHPATAQAVSAGQNCVTCHQVDYQNAQNPVHVGAMPTQCEDCHSTAGWQPALAGNHPEASFPIASGNHALPCQSCHIIALGAATAGQNTDCIGCHGGDHTQAVTDPKHVGVSDYHFDASMPHFCLTCHPDGTAASHPEALFPITSGAHRGIACNDCHDATLGSDIGGMNANCTGCHDGTHNMARAASDHTDVRNYVWSDTDKKFCLTCHPNGRSN